MQPNVSVFAIGELLERLSGEFTYHGQAKGLELRVIACGLHVRSDKHLLEQMVRNLVSNAIKYTTKGRVLLGCRRHSDMLSLEVWDTGIGVAAADLNKIFEEYFQVGNAARQRSRGLGLGLSIVNRLGDLLGHPVHVQSRLGSGSVFSVDLPCEPQAKTSQPAVPLRNVPNQGHGLRILVVEDDPDVAETLAALLLDQGYDVRTTPDGLAALESVASITPDLVLADSRQFLWCARVPRTCRRSRSACWGTSPVLIKTSAGRWLRPASLRRTRTSTQLAKASALRP